MEVLKVNQIPYKRADVSKVKIALDKFLEINNNAKCVQDVLDARKVFNDAMEEFNTYASLAYVRYSQDTRDEFYLGEQDFYDQEGPTVSGYYSTYASAMVNSPFRAELEKLLPETLFPSYECAIKSHSKETEDLERLENSIVTEYSQLLAQVTMDWEGEEKPLSYVRGFMEDSSRDVRRKATVAVGQALEKISDKLDDIYDRLVKVRTKIAKMLGYENYIELGYYRMSRIDYNKEMVETFRENVLSDLVPVVTALKKEIQKNCGFDKIYFYDNEVIEGATAPVPFDNLEGIVEAARKMYKEMSPVTHEFMEKMVKTGAFDLDAREGKCGGGYATTFDSLKQCFVFANFNGSSGDVDVMTHEFGHALAFDFAFKHGDGEVGCAASMETAETHSMSMEFFAWPHMDKFFKNADLYRYKHLASALTFIPYGVIVDEFQHIMYQNPDLTPAERNKVYLELEAKYRPYMTFEGLPYLEKGTRWQYQSHIYESPFYYIDYCLAQVIALEFLDLSQKDYEGALNRYFEHLKRGGRFAFNRLALLAGLDSPFKKGALKEVAKCATNTINQIKSRLNV